MGLFLGGLIGLSLLGAHSDGSSFPFNFLFRGEKQLNLALDVGSKAPDFKLYSLEGELIKVSDVLGKPVILNFWATWCTPCKIEMPLLQEKYNRYNSNLLILGVNAGESKNTVEKFLNNNKISFPNVLDPNELIQEMYGIRAYPTTYFIDKGGVIQAVYIGILSEKQLDVNLRKIGVING